MDTYSSREVKQIFYVKFFRESCVFTVNVYKMKTMFCAVLTGIFVQYVTAIGCFECADCRVPFDDDNDGVTKKECENSSCMKLNITHADKFSIVSRGCSGDGMEEDRCEMKEVSGTYSETCYCNSDGCNGSSGFKLKDTVRMLYVITLTTALLA